MYLHTKKNEIIKHTFPKLLQTCYFGYFRFWILFQQTIPKKLYICYPMYFGHAQTSPTTPNKRDKFNLCKTLMLISVCKESNLSRPSFIRYYTYRSLKNLEFAKNTLTHNSRIKNFATHEVCAEILTAK